MLLHQEGSHTGRLGIGAKEGMQGLQEAAFAITPAAIQEKV